MSQNTTNGNVTRGIESGLVTFDELIGFANSITETINSTMSQNDTFLKDQLLLIDSNYKKLIELINSIDKEIDALLNSNTSTKSDYDRVKRELKEMNDKRNEVKQAIKQINDTYATQIGNLTKTNEDFVRSIKVKDSDVTDKLTNLSKKIAQSPPPAPGPVTGGRKGKRNTRKQSGGYVWGSQKKSRSNKRSLKKRHSFSKSKKGSKRR